MTSNGIRYYQYLSALTKEFKKLAKIEFLQPDNSVAFSLDNNYKRGYRAKFDTRAFIQDGSLNVSLQNGKRRSASITLSNLDGAFDYAINKIWFGQRVRLSMGLVLPDGTDFYLPQGVFYISNPSAAFKPNQRSATFNLVDKWAYLDGDLFGTLDNSYKIERTSDKPENTIWGAMRSLLTLSKKDFQQTTNREWQVDNVTPVFTTYYDGRKYTLKDGTQVNMTDIPYEIIVSGDNATLANVMLELNGILVGWIGYDQTGTLRVDASQDDIEDNKKPVLWNFTPENSQLLGVSEIFKNSEVYNDVIIIGQKTESKEAIYGRASNYDPKSDTNINLIGRRTYKESHPNYWNETQCKDLATFKLKRKTVLQNSITIESSQMFHLAENNIVTVKRTDKPNSPVEKHLIQSYTLPIGETGEMTVNCVSTNDLPDLGVVVSTEL